ncbi:hypothetical protein B0T16DRAFT_450496 [Cercophora newfieldiana]|uniref:Uncharacterized protein n=1 Tax=Cercophora newfieldiana TaxID=92897 RepID=A0AA39YLE4_9PEZI|nr:hypothetical protein B0T16DRAFT_450496 [Cercophora newfieldiana]
MKAASFLWAGFGLLSTADAKCCRQNLCLKAIVDLENDGIAECSSLLHVTVAPDSTATIFETTTVPGSAEYSTILFTETDTESSTVTASTETIVHVRSSTTTASTETITYTSITTVTDSTETITETSTTTKRPTASIGLRGLITSSGPAVPDYATLVCPSWEKYVSACSCAGVTPSTTTEGAASTTITLESTSPVLVIVSSVVTSTDIQIASVTATVSSVFIDVVSATTTTETTTTTTTTDTATSEVTSTATTTAACYTAPPGGQGGEWEPFRAEATQHPEAQYNPLHLYAELEYSPKIMLEKPWGQGTIGQPEEVIQESRYYWGIDASNGRLYVMDGGVKYNAWVRIAYFPNSDIVLSPVAEAETIVFTHGVGKFVHACIAPDTGELHLNGDGLTRLLFCAGSVHLVTPDYDFANDPNWSYCIEMFPKMLV